MDKGGNFLDSGGNFLDLGGNLLDLGGNFLDMRIIICPAPFLIALFSNHHLYSPSQSFRNFLELHFGVHRKPTIVILHGRDVKNQHFRVLHSL